MPLISDVKFVSASALILTAIAACGGGQFDDADEYAADYGYDEPADFPAEMAEYRDVFDASGLPVAAGRGESRYHNSV